MQAAKIWAVALLLGLAGLPSPALAAGGGEGLMQQANNDLENVNSLQRGARNFMNYCVGCHSMQYVRYNRLATDLGLSEEQLRDNLIFGVDKINAYVTTAMTREQATSWFSAVPPDLSLTSRSRGVDWIYTYLKSFYLDNSRTFGVNNKMLEGSSMPHVLWELQGLQTAVYRDEAVMEDSGKESMVKVFDHFTLDEEGSMNPKEFDGFVRDTVNFMDYVGEPVKIKRQKIGMMVLGFLLVLAVLAYALKVEYWKDIH